MVAILPNGRYRRNFLGDWEQEDFWGDTSQMGAAASTIFVSAISVEPVFGQTQMSHQEPLKVYKPLIPFEFTPDLLIGDPAIDADHLAFFELAKLLNESLASDSGDLVITSAIEILKEYVDGHFWREEKAMKKVGYPNLQRHKILHDKFREKILKGSEANARLDMTLVKELPNVVDSWLRVHIVYEDAQYRHWISKNCVDHRPLVMLAIESEFSR
jgi:hemerythrin